MRRLSQRVPAEPRLNPGGKCEMATLELKAGTPLGEATVARLVSTAAMLNRTVGDPQARASART